MASSVPQSADLCGLPAELILDIATWSQHSWLAGICDGHAPTPDVHRPQTALVDQDDCRGVRAGLVPECLADRVIQPRAPAHAMIQVNRRLRSVLSGTQAIWKSANTLFHSVASLGGRRATLSPAIRAARADFAYGSDVLVADKACSCLIRGIRRFYPTLRVVRISLPWADFMQPDPISIAHFFQRHHSKDASPLQHFDLHLHEDPHTTSGFLLPFQSPAITTCRITNAEVFPYGLRLELLYIAFPMSVDHCFGPSLLNALNCCPNLQFFTFDGGRCRLIEAALGDAFEDQLPIAVQLPSLRYLRMLLPAEVMNAVLGRMALPAGCDIHLEPVSSWRDAITAPRPAQAAHLSSMIEPSEGNEFWRFVATVLFPARARATFRNPSLFTMPEGGQEEDILRGISAIALDIHCADDVPTFGSGGVDISNSISLIFAPTVEGLNPMLGDTRCKSYRMPSAENKAQTLRSLTIRDSIHVAGDILPAGACKRPEQGVWYLAGTAFGGQVGTDFRGVRHIQTLVIPQDSWLPDTRRGWELLLKAFTVDELILHATGELHGSETFLALSEYLAMRSALAQTPSLNTVHLPHYCVPGGTAGALKSRLESASNDPSRMTAGSLPIKWLIGDPGHLGGRRSESS